MTLSEAARRELLEAAASAALREDMRILRRNREARDRRMTAAEYVAFATACSALFGHPVAPRRPFREGDMRL